MWNRSALIVVVLIASVLFVSGCTFPGANVFQVNNPVTKVGSGDILTIKDVRSIPYSPVITSEDVSLEFILENLDIDYESEWGMMLRSAFLAGWKLAKESM